ncbi:hypothetical protein [Amycolatopsis sp. RTGN1]|uniref:hypothetical protein n=1 Tax=Amycolatopsis ponsaeliensis TaxID=2992142 RepID=UPI00254DF910|nr:hypothetical protein [Amycolatopsis sp. RTGN1]
MSTIVTPTPRFKALVRRRREHTGETHAQAVTEITRCGLLPAAGSRWQEYLESWLLSELNRWNDWSEPDEQWPWPASTVLGITAVTPRPHELVLHVHPAAQFPFLEMVLPGAVPDKQTDIGRSEVPLAYAGGVPGLRAVHTRRGLELSWPGAGALILLAGMRRDRWLSLERELRAFWAEDEDEIVPQWDTRGWLTGEKAWILFDPKFDAGVRAAWVDSGLLRRLGLFGETQPLWVACSNDALRRSVTTVDVDFGPLDRRPRGPGTALPETASVDLVASPFRRGDSPWPVRPSKHPRLLEDVDPALRAEIEALETEGVAEMETWTVFDRLPAAPWLPSADPACETS